MNPDIESHNSDQVPTELQQIDNQLSEYPLFWGKYYCRNAFRMKSPSFHHSILDEVDKSNLFAIVAPRQSAKSTLLAYLYTLHKIVYKKKRYIIILSNTFDKAKNTLHRIKMSIIENKLIQNRYKIQMITDTKGDTIFVHPDGFQTRVLCKGNEQMGSIRGELFGDWRPDLIIVDDLEDDKMVLNPTRRDEVQGQFDSAVMPALDRKDGKLIAIGTILHDDSLIKKLVSKSYYPQFNKMFFQARSDDKKSSLWKEMWTVEELNTLERLNPRMFAQEYQNNPTSGLMQRFFKKDFRYWRVENMDYMLLDLQGHVTARGRLSDCKAAICNDLAWTEKRESDSTVIMPAFLTPQNEILIGKYVVKQGLRPDQFAEYIFTLEKRLRSITNATVPIGFEKAMLERVTQWVLKREMRSRNHFLSTVELKWETDKVARIDTVLQPRYSQNVIYHQHDMGDLEHELMKFPSGKHDDIIDALQGVCRMLQYPKSLSTKEQKVDSEFDWWRKHATGARHNQAAQSRYVFGNKNNQPVGIPSKQGCRLLD